MTAVRWERYPLVASMPTARAWLQIQGDLGLAANTVEAYGRGLEAYLRFTASRLPRSEPRGGDNVSLPAR